MGLGSRILMDNKGSTHVIWGKVSPPHESKVKKYKIRHVTLYSNNSIVISIICTRIKNVLERCERGTWWMCLNDFHSWRTILRIIEIPRRQSVLNWHAKCLKWSTHFTDFQRYKICQNPTCRTQVIDFTKLDISRLHFNDIRKVVRKSFSDWRSFLHESCREFNYKLNIRGIKLNRVTDLKIWNFEVGDLFWADSYGIGSIGSMFISGSMCTLRFRSNGRRCIWLNLN